MPCLLQWHRVGGMFLTSATVYQQKDHNNEDRYNNQPDNDIRQEFR